MKSRAASSNPRGDADALPVFDDAAPSARESAPTPREMPRALRVLFEAFKCGKLPHALLFYGNDFETVEVAAHALAAEVLGAKNPASHPDFSTLRPSGKARLIKIGDEKDDDGSRNTMRAFLRGLHMTPLVGTRKIGCVYEADRLNPSSTNAFLKTLEEPPPDTTLFLLTARPRELLPTIHSRCFHLRIPSETRALADETWARWRADFATWLETLRAIGANAPDAEKNPARVLLPLYGLSGRLGTYVQTAADARWDAEKDALPPHINDDEKAALEEGARRGVRERILREVEHVLRDFAVARLADDEAPRLVESVAALERARGLLAVNYAEANAFEDFLLRTLRAWTRPRT